MNRARKCLFFGLLGVLCGFGVAPISAGDWIHWRRSGTERCLAGRRTARQMVAGSQRPEFQSGLEGALRLPIYAARHERPRLHHWQ